MKGTKGKRVAWLVFLFMLVLVPCVRAVILEGTGDPTYNTNAPTGSLTNSGWQYEGQWGVYLGTPIAPTFFLAAHHIGGSPGQPFVFNGVTYTTVTNFDDPSTDLRIWQVGQTFSNYAPLYTASDEEDKLCVVIGRGTQRGSPVVVDYESQTRTNGWQWGAGDTVERWGENTVAAVYTDTQYYAADQLLQAAFQGNGMTNECDLSVGDSSGAMFIESGSTWELAGINFLVGNSYVSSNGASGSGFSAALVDLRGLYYEDCDGGCWTLYAPTNDPEVYPNDYAFFSTRVSVRVSWINGVLTNRPTAVFSASPTNGAAPLTVTFTDSSTGPITNRFWSFGDGVTTNFVNSTNPTHTYTAGVYDVTLIVRGSGGASTNTVANMISAYAPFAWWQLRYFGCTNCAQAQPNADPSGTGMSNTNEFLAGFNPTNAAAYLHVISIATTNTTDMNVVYLGANGDSTWSPGIASRTNVLEFTAGTASGGYSNNFASTGQTNILSGGTGTGIVTNMVDAGGATNTPSRYYRVRVLLP
jgi:PKD repeat protein